MATIGDFNTSTIDFSSYSDPEKMDGKITPPGVSWIEEGRWTGKNALEFSGGYVNCGSNPKLDVNKEFTVEAWIKTTWQGEWFTTVVAKYGTYAEVGAGKVLNSWGLGLIAENEMGFYIRDKDNKKADPSAPNWGNDGKWHHIVGIRGNGKVTFYGDGELKETQSDGVGDVTNDNSLTIGKHKDHPFHGTIGEVAIYNRALSPLEIINHYEMGRP